MPKRPIDQDLARIPLFSALSKAHLRNLSSLATAIHVPAGRVLMREDEPGEELVVIVEGEAEIRRDGKTIATRGPGDFFGEISLLLDRPHTASVVATTDMTLQVIGRRAFKALLKEDPQLYEPLLHAAVERLAELEAKAP